MLRSWQHATRPKLPAGDFALQNTLTVSERGKDGNNNRLQYGFCQKEYSGSLTRRVFHLEGTVGKQMRYAMICYDLPVLEEWMKNDHFDSFTCNI